MNLLLGFFSIAEALFSSVNLRALVEFLHIFSRSGTSPLMCLGPKNGNSGLEYKEVNDDTQLKEWLGDKSTSTPAGGLVTKKDPKCRFM